ncbi:tellurite resistance protein [Azospirillum fermentarium]|uniref:tellurite resistance TerB family protein n=1 Tax=Azospirillum fermentarium TaxID=1233114 RepID=UPI0022274DDF|nr:tellurite resistance TerB family protein [Azospirillum fermentarium]MCW2244848.1 tellurite resistance protein [Azospirillum fermentarium]
MLLRWIERLLAATHTDLARAAGVLPPETVLHMVDAAALVASADGPGAGRVTRGEATETLGLVRQLANLRRLGMEHARTRFEDTVDRLEREGEPARTVLLDRLAALSDRPEHARLLLHVAGAVAAVDGQVSGAEQEMLDRLARTLGLPTEAQRADSC